MAIDEIPDDGQRGFGTRERHSHTGWLIAIAVVLALVVVGEYVAFNRISSLRSSIQAEDTKIHEQLASRITDDFSGKLSALANSNAQQLDALRSELDGAAQRLGSTGRELGRARKMVSDLQQQQAQQSSELKREIAQKADQQQVGTLSQDVSATRSDLADTKKTVGTLTSDLGMSRSELGTLIARNHDEIEQLRKMGQREYIEFTLARNQQQSVAGVGLILRKANVKRHLFNLDLLTNDMVIQKNSRTVDEPVFFSVGGQRGFYELVVNNVERDKASGYISTPKYGVEVPAQQASNPNK